MVYKKEIRGSNNILPQFGFQEGKVHNHHPEEWGKDRWIEGWLSQCIDWLTRLPQYLFYRGVLQYLFYRASPAFIIFKQQSSPLASINLFNQSGSDIHSFIRSILSKAWPYQVGYFVPALKGLHVWGYTRKAVLLYKLYAAFPQFKEGQLRLISYFLPLSCSEIDIMLNAFECRFNALR